MEFVFNSLVKKATDFLGIGSPSSHSAPPLDGEIVFCKNNVCVHPPASLTPEIEHHPGYLYIRSQDDEVLGTTLILSWIPNTHLKKNPRSIENSPLHPKISPRRSPRQEYTSTEWSPSDSHGNSLTSSPSNDSVDNHKEGKLSTDVTSISSNDSSTVEKLTDKSGSSQKCCLDSGIGGECNSLEGILNNALINSNLKNELQNNSEISDNGAAFGQNIPNVGQNVNRLHYKDTNCKKINTNIENSVANLEIVSPMRTLTATTVALDNNTNSESSHVTESSSNPDLKPNLSSQKNKSPLNSQRDRINERISSGSNRSVTSIEMEGDKLVVVTEDSPFTDEIDEDDQDYPDDNAYLSNNSDESHPGCKYPTPGGAKYSAMLEELTEITESKLIDGEVEKNTLDRSKKFNLDKLKDSLALKLDLNSLPSHNLDDVTQNEESPDIAIDYISDGESSATTSGPDSRPPTPVSPLSCPEPPASPDSSSSGNAVHNIMFPSNSISYNDSPIAGSVTSKTAKEQVCGVFSVDLGQMRFLRVFYNNDNCSNGHLIIASRESQYKILHFHNGGLDRLSERFRDWKFLAKTKSRGPRNLPKHCKQFTVIRPYLPNKDRHPDEGAYEAVNQETWHRHMSATGQIEDHFYLRKATFFAGIEPNARQEVWPFLLGYYPYTSTFEEREEIRNDRYIEYQNIRKNRESMADAEKEAFWRSVQCIVEKDVVRTDRSHPYYRGVNNPNIEVLQNILLNYAVAHPKYGYTQGMSDLLAPVLIEVQNEADAYWCFVGLMQKTIFVSSPKDVDMDQQLNHLRELIRIMLPHFYAHMQKVQDGMELLFCHRWILLCFKREFPECDVLRMWEACWGHYQTDCFNLFISLAIISVYGEDVIEQDMAADDMLLHFSSLSMHMNGGVILKKARAMSHKFRTRRNIPCTLQGLCILCGSGMWDSGHVPTIKCVGNHPEGIDNQCPYGGVVETPTEESAS